MNKEGKHIIILMLGTVLLVVGWTLGAGWIFHAPGAGNGADAASVVALLLGGVLVEYEFRYGPHGKHALLFVAGGLSLAAGWTLPWALLLPYVLHFPLAVAMVMIVSFALDAVGGVLLGYESCRLLLPPRH